MPAINTTIQPRRTPPKPQDAAAIKQYQELKAAQLKHAAATAAQVLVPPPEIKGSFPDLQEVFVSPVASYGTTITALEKLENADPIPSKNKKKKASVVSNQQGGVLQPEQPRGPKPPSTRQEYVDQHRAGNIPYPDVAEMFTGRAIDQPINGIIQTPTKAPMPLPVAPPVEVVVKHQLPEKQLAYRVTKNILTYINGQCVEFKRDDIIYDTYSIDQLLMGGCDSLVPLELAEKFISCPACRHQFPPNAG